MRTKKVFSCVCFLCFHLSEDSKQRVDRDDTPPRTPTGNALSSESDLEVSSPGHEAVASSNNPIVSQEEDERLAKELSLKEAAAHDLSHRPKRRRFHESYNFNMKCPTPGCNSLGEGPAMVLGFSFLSSCVHLSPFFFLFRTSNWETRETFLHIWLSSLPQSLC